MGTVNRVEKLLPQCPQVLDIRSDRSVAAAARKMKLHHVGCLVVVDEEGVISGIVSERDIVTRVVARNRDPEAVAVGEIATSSVVHCSPSTSLNKAQEIMAEHGIRHLPIIQDGVAVGMISSRDIIAHQLSSVKAIVRRQAKTLQRLEETYPGITRLERDASGRLVI